MDIMINNLNLTTTTDHLVPQKATAIRQGSVPFNQSLDQENNGRRMEDQRNVYGLSQVLRDTPTYANHRNNGSVTHLQKCQQYRYHPYASSTQQPVFEQPVIPPIVLTTPTTVPTSIVGISPVVNSMNVDIDDMSTTQTAEQELESDNFVESQIQISPNQSMDVSTVTTELYPQQISNDATGECHRLIL